MINLVLTFSLCGSCCVIQTSHKLFLSQSFASESDAQNKTFLHRFKNIQQTA